MRIQRFRRCENGDYVEVTNNPRQPIPGIPDGSRGWVVKQHYNFDVVDVEFGKVGEKSSISAVPRSRLKVIKPPKEES